MPKKKTKETKSSTSRRKSAKPTPKPAITANVTASMEMEDTVQVIESPSDSEIIQKQADFNMGKQESPDIAEKQLVSEETSSFQFDKREHLITTFTAGGVVLSFGLTIGSALVIPLWPAGSGLLATLGIISGFGAFMARESI
ncbi:MAG: hypothetical protein ABIG39_02025 [Candidatus Micrarchaeota archaeon]